MPKAVDLLGSIGQMFGSHTIDVKNTPPEPSPVPFTATHYDPWDPRQTKPNPDGIGAFNKPVVFGDVAIPRDSKLKPGSKVAIDELKDVQTPYGMGIFRVNDTFGPAASGQSKLDVALPYSAVKGEYKDLQKRIGNNQFNYKVLPE